MANGTPSTSISLGADLLEQMGDLKGAAKELAAEAKNAKKDVSDATKEFKELEKQQKKNKKKVYTPRMVLTLGNHEQRIMRHVDSNPELADFLSYDKLKYK